MKKILYFIVVFAVVVAAFALTACGKKDSETESGLTDIVAEIPYVSDFTCDYYAGEGFADRVARSTAFGSEDEVLIKLSFTLSPEAFKDGKRRLTIKPILSEGFYGSIVSANTSSVNNIDLTAAYDVDDRRSKNCEIELKTKFNHSNGELQIGYLYDGEEYQTTGSYALSCCQPLKFTYDAEIGGYIVLRDMGNEGWLTDVEHAKIPDTFCGKPITAIGENAFSYCENLANIAIPDTVINIGKGAFANCSGLTNITIPDSVTSIGDYAFFGCDKLKCNEYENGCYLGNEQNPYIVFIKLKYADVETITNIDVNKTTKFIHSSAFVNCIYLTSIKIPDSVTSIGYRAFSDCSNLTNIEIPDSVMSIGGGAFMDCRSLTNIEIPDSVTSIGSNVFYGCSSLTSITIPDSMTSIGDMAFSHCSNLTNITIPDTTATTKGNKK